MSPPNEARWVKVVNQLNRDTQEGKLKWNRDNKHRYEALYLAPFKRWMIGVFEESKKEYSDDVGEWYSYNVTKIGLFDPNSKDLLYLVPEKEGLSELYEAVQRQHSDADTFAKVVLGGEDDDIPF